MLKVLNSAEIFAGKNKITRSYTNKIVLNEMI